MINIVNAMTLNSDVQLYIMMDRGSEHISVALADEINAFVPGRRTATRWLPEGFDDPGELTDEALVQMFNSIRR